MLQYKMIIDKSNFSEILEDLLSAVKYTSLIHDYNLHVQLKNSLYNIIVNNKYNTITSKNGYRDLVRRYNPDVYFNIVYYLACKIDKNNILNTDNGYYNMNKDYIENIINDLCDRYLNSYIDSFEIKKTVSNTVAKPEKVIYYDPSNRLKAEIMNGVQTTLKNSSSISNGMMAYSHIGKGRDKQDDSYYIGVHPANSNFKIMVVADGMGGYSDGGIASNIAVKHIINWFENLSAREFYDSNNDNLFNSLNNEIQIINNDILNSTTGGTTLCISIIKNNNILFSNIGDSKGYVFENGNLVFNTIPEDVAHLNNVPEVLTRFYKGSNGIYNYLGCNNHVPIPKFSAVSIRPDCSYKIILCSDGVTDCLGDKKIVDIVNNNGLVAQALVECALENDSYLKYELQNFGFFARRKINESMFNTVIHGGKDNATAVFGEIEPKIELQVRRK